MNFPLKGGGHWTLYREDVAEWQAHFPTVRVEDECRHACAWCEANPRRRKTEAGMRRFLVAWLTRSAARQPHRYVPHATDWTCPHRDEADRPLHGTEATCVRWDHLLAGRREQAEARAELPLEP